MIERWDGVPGLYDVYAAAQAVDDPLGPVLPPRLFLAWLAHAWEDEPREVWYIPGTGWYRLLLPEPENRDRAVLDLVVAPTARRRVQDVAKAPSRRPGTRRESGKRRTGRPCSAPGSTRWWRG
jgi:hypothetical protein